MNEIPENDKLDESRREYKLKTSEQDPLKA